jgi:uncharacterized membrane protein YfcA
LFLENSYLLSPFQWTLAVLAALLIGISKAGLSSISILHVLLLAAAFGSKSSTGVLLPMLIVGDILAVVYYKRSVQWSALLRLAPYVMTGILLGVWIGKDLDEAIFKKMMASIVLIIVLGMVYLEKKPLQNVSSSFWVSSIVGITTGFTSMVGNQAGGFATAYFMSMRLPKANFISTFAWLFLFINLFKLPFHIFSWHTVTWSSLGINLFLLPVQIIGFYLGVYIVRQLDEARYRTLILWLTVAAALFVFL